MFSVENLTVSFGSFNLLDDIGFVVDKKDKIALVGKNGAGKSTLLKIFAGLYEPSKGRVSMPKEATIGYLPQQMNVSDERTVREEAALAFEHIHRMETELDRLNVALTERTDYESDSYHQLIDHVTHLSERLAMEGSANVQAEIEKTLTGLGFLRSDFDRPTNEFSGGWRMRIELAKILLRKPDILLLDEPTNHLDIESIQWLENFLSTQANAVVLVSHDRAFIDNVTKRTIEISLGKTYDYRVNYSKYVELRKERREQQLRAYENQRKQIEETEDFIERFRYKATKAVQVQSRIKQLDKLERLEVDEEDKSALRLKFPPAPRSGAYPVIAENLSKRYGAHWIFKEATLTINRGDKVAFVGKNGEGKSTLVKCIMEQIPYDGKLQLGHNVKIGYFAQNQADLMDEKRTVFQTIDDVATGDIRTKIRDILGAFMFGGDNSDKKVAVLSGGERTRLAMIKLLLEPVNLLILDEPTNHLDMRSKDVLKDALREFDGTVIVVSHDREFLDGLVDKVYEFGNQQVKEHLGGIYAFLDKKKIESLNELASPPPALLPEEKGQVESWGQRKEQQRQLRRLEKAVADCEKKIEPLEAEIREMEAMLVTPEGASNVDLLWKHADMQKKLEAVMDEWAEATVKLEVEQGAT
ncbi:MAG: putative ABC transporter ATP-binding protein YheS [Candidatus Ordinivivax streblomastigis]|uniref:Probable ATP-binding protein YbiT n=1 Tax=Candidatus Ordinivivax streblomastigis TaxID=2540710 RepID=A0A5M8P1E4_9BACT|nr:MAG: putative ABC transporter ATP-binding protein YheS [Candidatus Ordinivivax streblomastigis]